MASFGSVEGNVLFPFTMIDRLEFCHLLLTQMAWLALITVSLIFVNCLIEPFKELLDIVSA